jgi:hypothetical protein
MKQTALYFNPELDTVHIIVGSKHTTQFWALSNIVDKETIQSIKMLAIEIQGFDDEWARYFAGKLVLFARLETLISVVGDETRRDEEGSSNQVNMEDHLVKVKDQLVLRGDCTGWNLPVVKVMTRQAFETHLWS